MVPIAANFVIQCQTTANETVTQTDDDALVIVEGKLYPTAVIDTAGVAYRARSTTACRHFPHSQVVILAAGARLCYVDTGDTITVDPFVNGRPTNRRTQNSGV